MITVYIGTPQQKISGEVVDVTLKDFTHVWDSIQTPSLFGDKKNFILKNVFENEVIKKEIITRLKDLENTSHDVVIITEQLLAADKKIFEKIADIKESKKEAKKESGYSPFGFANTFALADKKKTWIAFQELLEHEDEMEKTHGLIWWKVKDMIVHASRGATHGTEKNKLIVMARVLVVVYHESRLGGLEMKERLERFFLKNK